MELGHGGPNSPRKTPHSGRETEVPTNDAAPAVTSRTNRFESYAGPIGASSPRMSPTTNARAHRPANYPTPAEIQREPQHEAEHRGEVTPASNRRRDDNEQDQVRHEPQWDEQQDTTLTWRTSAARATRPTDPTRHGVDARRPTCRVGDGEMRTSVIAAPRRLR